MIELPDTKMELITRKPVYPTDEEYERNPRSKSAKLRAARRNKKELKNIVLIHKKTPRGVLFFLCLCRNDDSDVL